MRWTGIVVLNSAVSRKRSSAAKPGVSGGMDADNEISGCMAGENRRLKLPDPRHFHDGVPGELHPFSPQTLQIGEQTIGRGLEPSLVKGGLGTVKQIAEQTRSDVSIKEIVFEAILEAP